MTSTPPGAWMMPTYTRRPSLLIAMLFGCPLSGIAVGDLQRLGIDDVERALGFVADVDAAAVGRHRRAMVRPRCR